MNDFVTAFKIVGIGPWKLVSPAVYDIPDWQAVIVLGELTLHLLADGNWTKEFLYSELQPTFNLWLDAGLQMRVGFKNSNIPMIPLLKDLVGDNIIEDLWIFECSIDEDFSKWIPKHCKSISVDEKSSFINAGHPFCEALSDPTSNITSLSIYLKEPLSIQHLASTIRVLPSLCSLQISRCHNNKDEDVEMLLNAACENQNVSCVFYSEPLEDMDFWLPRLLAMIQCNHISSIEYCPGLKLDVDVGVEELYYTEKVIEFVEALSMALQNNRCLTDLTLECTSSSLISLEIDVNHFLERNEILKLMKETLRKFPESQSDGALIGKMLCEYPVRMIPTLMFELLQEANQVVAQLWHDRTVQRAAGRPAGAKRKLEDTE